MTKRLAKTVLRLFLVILMLFTTEISFSQEQSVYVRRFQNGTQLYNLAHFYEAAAEFRYAQEISTNTNDWSRALYWVILSELGASDYGSALRDMDELERRSANSSFTRDMLYHRARIYFNQGFFDNSLILFKRYIDSVTEEDREAEDRKAAAYFWAGETLFFMGRFDEAESFYAWVATKYPQSPKHDISTYRMDLIKQKKIEAELLALLQWSHEEALRTSEEYQRKIRTYEFTLSAYQRRIAELTNEKALYQNGSLETRTNGNNGNNIELSTENIRQVSDQFDGDFENAFNQINMSSDSDEVTPEELLERARQLGYDLEQIINGHENGGY